MGKPGGGGGDAEENDAAADQLAQPGGGGGGGGGGGDTEEVELADQLALDHQDPDDALEESSSDSQVSRRGGADLSFRSDNENENGGGDSTDSESYQSDQSPPQWTADTVRVLEMLRRNMELSEFEQLSYDVLSSGYTSSSYTAQVSKELRLLGHKGFISLERGEDDDTIITPGPRFYEGVESEDEEMDSEDSRDDSDTEEEGESLDEDGRSEGNLSAESIP